MHHNSVGGNGYIGGPSVGPCSPGISLGSTDRPVNPSIQRTAEFCSEAAERLLGRIAYLLGRLDLQPVGPNKLGGDRPSMPILQHLAMTHDHINHAEKLLSQLEEKVFG